jgi:putative PIN family toxin of toxin-antitoxin system
VRVVLDTNVVVSAAFFMGLPEQVLSAWNAGQFELVVTPEILQEYRAVGVRLGREYPERRAEFDVVLSLIMRDAVVIDATRLQAPVSKDADDDKFLAAAHAAGAMYIVSGDRDLLEVSGWREILVLKPRDFLLRLP